MSAGPEAARTDERVPVRDDLFEVTPYGAPQVDAPVRLNTNETPWPPPAAFVDALRGRLAELDLHRYPDRRAWELRTALGRRYGLPPEQVWAANGSNEVLAQLLQAYGGPGRRLLGTRPGFAALATIARTTATAMVAADLDERLRLDPQAAADAVGRHDPDVVCLANPNNPTGTLAPLEAVRALHDAGRALVIVDEAYGEFADATALDLLEELPRLVVTRTFSKAFRLAGIRLGYLLGPDWVVDDLRRVRLPYHLGTLTQAAGVVACEHAETVTGHIGDIVAERERLAAALAERGVRTWPSQANFLLVRVDAPGGDDLFARLLDHGVLVRDFSAEPRLEGCVRVTVGSREDNDAFLAALDAVTKEAGDQPGS